MDRRDAIALLGFQVLGSRFPPSLKLRRTGPVPGSQGSRFSVPTSIRVGVLQPDGRYTITPQPMERYVSRVLAGEALRDSRPSALEALAIAIRTYAIANAGRHRTDGFDLCDQTHCQVVRAASAATDRAAAATAGRLLLRADAPASVFYTASCGGRSEIPSEVWPGAEDPLFLPSRKDDACEGAPEWRAEFDAPDVLRALRAAGFSGDRLRKLRIDARNRSGRVSRLKLDGMTPNDISGQDFRVAVGRTLGWLHIKSTIFDLRQDGATHTFHGRGSGHGVGMCVIGAARLADHGRSAGDILERYYPGLKISKR